MSDMTDEIIRSQIKRRRAATRESTIMAIIGMIVLAWVSLFSVSFVIYLLSHAGC